MAGSVSVVGGSGGAGRMAGSVSLVGRGGGAGSMSASHAGGGGALGSEGCGFISAAPLR